MKMILRPYQYIYVSRNEHEILFYNIVKNRIYTYQIPFEEYIIKGGNIIFNGENQYSSALHSIFETEQLGEKIVSSKIFCCNQYDILKEGFKISITNHDIISSDISKYVLQITAYIDSVLFPKRNSWEEEYSAPDFLTKLSSFMRQYSNLQKIQLVVKKFSLQIIEPFIAEFYTTHSLEIICSTANLQYIKKLKRKYPEILITCILDKKSLNPLIMNLYQQYVASYKYIVYNSDDLKMLNTLPVELKIQSIFRFHLMPKFLY